MAAEESVLFSGYAQVFMVTKLELSREDISRYHEDWRRGQSNAPSEYNKLSTTCRFILTTARTLAAALPTVTRSEFLPFVPVPFTRSETSEKIIMDEPHDTLVDFHLLDFKTSEGDVALFGMEFPNYFCMISASDERNMSGWRNIELLERIETLYKEAGIVPRKGLLGVTFYNLPFARHLQMLTNRAMTEGGRRLRVDLAVVKCPICGSITRFAVPLRKSFCLKCNRFLV